MPGGNNDIHPAQHDGLRRNRDGLKTRGALPVHGLARYADRKTCGKGGKTAEVHRSGACGQNASHDQIFDLARIDPSPADRC